MRRKNKLITTILAMVMVFPFFLGLGSAKDVMGTENPNQTSNPAQTEICNNASR